MNPKIRHEAVAFFLFAALMFVIYDIGILRATAPADTNTVSMACVPDWQCTDWSPCASGVQRRQCVDANGCGGPSPIVLNACTPAGAVVREGGIADKLPALNVALLLAVLVVAVGMIVALAAHHPKRR